MELLERNRLIAVTRGFNSLQGLYYAPIGMVLTAWVLLDMTWPRSFAHDLAKLVSLLLGIAACFAARWYYRRRFGVVAPHQEQSWNALAILVAFALMWGASYLDVKTAYPISFETLWWALFYVGCYLRPFRIRSFSLWFAAVFLILAFLPLTGTIPKEQFFMGRSGIGQFITWFAFALHGLLDHQLLMRLLPGARQQSAEQHV